MGQLRVGGSIDLIEYSKNNVIAQSELFENEIGP